jgi:AcrR family transcriptional regulator
VHACMNVLVRRTAEESARTRADLMDAALAVFAETGVANARLVDIAARANVTRGAVYHHFEDKMALYGAILAESWDALTVSVWAELDVGGSNRERLTAFLLAWLRDLRENERFRALLAITMNGSNPMPDGMSDTAKIQGFRDWQERLARVVSPSAAASLLAWLCGTAMLAAADPALLPTADAAGIEPLLGGMP